LPPETLAQLKNFDPALPFPATMEARYFKTEERPLANNLRKPPEDAVAFVSETDLLSLARVGFAGELLLLYATGLGLATCWFGHYITKEVNRLLPELAAPDPWASSSKSRGVDLERPAPANGDPAFGFGPREDIGRRVVCLSPLGFWEPGGLRPVDRLTAHLMSFKRKPIGERLTGGLQTEDLQPPVSFGLDMARKAPSAANSQHWTFEVSQDQRRVAIAKPVGYRHFKWEHPDVCVGACAAHFWLALELQAIPCALDLREEEGRAVWVFQL
jgi:nitroreductase